MSEENGADNLYTRIYRLLVTEQYVEAVVVLLVTKILSAQSA